MKNWRIRYTYDGYRFWGVVAANSAEEAVAYFEYLDNERHDCSVMGVTVEDPDYIVPAGWQRPEPARPSEQEIALVAEYHRWAWDRCAELDLDPEDCDVDFETWMREVHCNAN